jgi:hypothetical protein
MNPLKAKSVVLDMTFGSKADYDRFIRDVRRDGTIEQNILRGRIAWDTAWIRLELRGASGPIEELLGRWDEFILADAGELEQVA